MTDDIATADSKMVQAFANGSYWNNPGLQGEVRDAIVRGAEQAVETGKAVVPAGSPSSLSSGDAKDKAILESWMADKTSPYFRGDDTMTAAAYQQLYRNMLDAEARGDDTVTGPEYAGVDSDVPSKRTGYSLEGLPIHSAADRDIVDEALAHFHDSGFGQERTRDVLQWAYDQPSAPSEREFRSWARQRGWSSHHIRDAVQTYRHMKGTRA